MDVEEFKKKYEQLKDNPMYKNFCSILDTKNQVLERTAKKNQELKEQLSNSHQIKTQQKEFIEWLENSIKNLETEQARRFNHTYQYKIDVFKDCLFKYKEIVGGNNDQ